MYKETIHSFIWRIFSKYLREDIRQDELLFFLKAASCISELSYSGPKARL